MTELGIVTEVRIDLFQNALTSILVTLYVTPFMGIVLGIVTAVPLIHPVTLALELPMVYVYVRVESR